MRDRVREWRRGSGRPGGVAVHGARTGFRVPAALGALAGLVLLGACSSLDAKVHNLRELHHEDGGTSYRAALLGDFEYHFRRAFHVSAPLGVELELADEEPELVENPTRRTLRLLLALEEFPLERPRVLALRTEMYAWLAGGDPYVLARERCVIELARVGGLVGVTGSLELADDAAVPDVERLTLLLGDLVAAAEPALSGRGEGAERAELARRCRALAEAELDVRTSRRVLRTAAALLSADGASRPAFDPVRELVRAVAARATAIALTGALDDPDPRVRAAAVDAWVNVTENRCREIVADALRDDSDEVVHRALLAIAENGLPEPEVAGEAADASEEADVREAWVGAVLRLAVDSPSGTVSAAACAALGRITDAGFESLRFDEWFAWWERRAGEAAEEGS